MKAKPIRRKHVQREIRAVKYGAARDAIGTLSKNEDVYILTFGQFSLIDVLSVILDQTGPARVDISTWTAAHAHLDETADKLRNNKIVKMRWLVDSSFIARQPEYCRKMRALFGDNCIRAYKSHAKFMVIENDEWKIAVRTSMNMNENPRLENVEISHDPVLCRFLTQIVDSLFDEVDSGNMLFELPKLDKIENIKIEGMATCRRMDPPNKATIGKIR